ncbi:LssY C-terminal domain-containing protein [Aureimonas frigidaquae]|uniref:LssY-like C-terminal domain-containing protein n=1 Tax=Aureimonas frigidaquae TaxID=424757 RepID=A0A0P0Z421_9HYPH|nr:LssY C-terminal domain-containing protein [Aureimonas frigidaquae]BAT28691.1 hypothetical protein [Aureimonas frigidaquae]
MSRTTRWIQRFLFLTFAAAALWFVVTQVFDRMDQRLPVFLALIGTYAVAAYLVLPITIHAALAITRRNRIPRVTRAGDGLPADPVNIVLAGSQEALTAAFLRAGWTKADRLSWRSGWHMVTAFIGNKPYEAAPFSALYLFGRHQDIGFQQDIGASPRKRHHVRFWAADADPDAADRSVLYWFTRQAIDPVRAHVWVGAGTKDLGFGLQSLTFQISHRVDRDADAERDHILASLEAVGAVTAPVLVDAGAVPHSHFVTDGRIVHARLT